MPGTKLSVVIPCFNAGAYLAEALASVLTQQPVPDEVIVIDDGSTDGSGAFASGLGPRVRCMRQENQGISAARNRGIEAATSDVIAFLDADDIWPVGSVAARLTLLLAEPDLDCVSGLTLQFISPELPEEVRRGLVCPPDTSRARIAGAILVRRRVFDRVGMFDPAFRVGETLDWVARADAAGVTTRTVDHIVLHRRIHSTNTTLRLTNQKAEYLRVLKTSIDRRRLSTQGDPSASVES